MEALLAVAILRVLLSVAAIPFALGVASEPYCEMLSSNSNSVLTTASTRYGPKHSTPVCGARFYITGIANHVRNTSLPAPSGTVSSVPPPAWMNLPNFTHPTLDQLPLKTFEVLLVKHKDIESYLNGTLGCENPAEPRCRDVHDLMKTRCADCLAKVRGRAVGASSGCANRGQCLKLDRPVKKWNQIWLSNTKNGWTWLAKKDITFEKASGWTCLKNATCELKQTKGEDRFFDPSQCSARIAGRDFVKDEVKACVQALTTKEKHCYVEYKGTVHEDLRLLILAGMSDGVDSRAVGHPSAFIVGEVKWISAGEEGCPVSTNPGSTNAGARAHFGTAVALGGILVSVMPEIR